MIGNWRVTGAGVATAVWLAAAAVVAQDNPADGAGDRALEVPPPPPPLQSGEALEPEVTIRRTPRETIYEYRRNGALFLVRVQPQFGPVYHFVDIDGDGQLEYRPGDPLQNNIHQWLLFTW